MQLKWLSVIVPHHGSVEPPEDHASLLPRQPNRNQVFASAVVIADGMYHPSRKEKMTALKAPMAQITTFLTDVPQDIPDLLPSAAGTYGKKVTKLTEVLNKP